MVSTPKRVARSPPAGLRPAKRHATSSPEEGEVDSDPSSPKPRSTPSRGPSPTPKMAPKIEKKTIAFPFKPKMMPSRNDVVVVGHGRGSGVFSSAAAQSREKDREREREREKEREKAAVYERSASDEERIRQRELDDRSRRGDRHRGGRDRHSHSHSSTADHWEPSQSTSREKARWDREADDRYYAPTATQDDRRPRRAYEREHDNYSRDSRDHDRDHDHKRDKRSRHRDRRSRSRSISSSPRSVASKHRLPRAKSPAYKFSPPTHDYKLDREYDRRRDYVRDWDRHSDSYHQDHGYSRDDSRYGSRWQEDSYDDRQDDRYAGRDRDRGRRRDDPYKDSWRTRVEPSPPRRGGVDSYRPVSPRRDDVDSYRPISPAPRSHLRSPSPPKGPRTPPLPPPPAPHDFRAPPPPADVPPPPPPDDDRTAALPARHSTISISMPSRKPAAPHDLHSPDPLPLPSAKPDIKADEVVFPRVAVERKRTREPVKRTRKEEAEAYGRVFEGCGQQADYEVTTKVGEGTFGEVHKAVQKKDGRPVALKRILMHNEREGMPVTALREIKILKALRHPCIVPLLDMFVVKSDGKDTPMSVYMVFPYMDHDLAGLLENERVKLQPSHIKLYMRQLLEGTEYMHHNHILHRDMKAANLLISNTGSLQIADFGLARAFDPSVALGAPESKNDYRGKERKYTNCVVTRWYRPPELLMGARQYGGEIDMWGIGCVMGEMFFRKPILAGTSDADQLDKIWYLCGTPNSHTWPDWEALPGCEGVKRFQPQIRKVKTVYESIGPETCDLLDKLLICNPRERITASQALDHEYFWTDPLPADPKTLPSYEASHEFDKRGRRPPPGPPGPPRQEQQRYPPPPIGQPYGHGRGPPPMRNGHFVPPPGQLPFHSLPPGTGGPGVGYGSYGPPPPVYSRPGQAPPPMSMPGRPLAPGQGPAWGNPQPPPHLPPRPMGMPHNFHRGGRGGHRGGGGGGGGGGGLNYG